MKNSLMKKDDRIIRILEEKEDKVFLIDCIKKTMPKWYDKSFIENFNKCSDNELNIDLVELDSNSVNMLKREGVTVTKYRIKRLTNMREENLEACMPYLTVNNEWN